MFLAEKILDNGALVSKIKSAKAEQPMSAADMKKWLAQEI